MIAHLDYSVLDSMFKDMIYRKVHALSCAALLVTTKPTEMDQSEFNIEAQVAAVLKYVPISLDDNPKNLYNI